MYIVYTLQIQDGEQQRYEYRSMEIPENSTKEEINKFGEEIIEEEYTGEEEGEWRWCSSMETMGRYYSYNVIPNKESYDLINRIIL